MQAASLAGKGNKRSDEHAQGSQKRTSSQPEKRFLARPNPDSWTGPRFVSDSVGGDTNLLPAQFSPKLASSLWLSSKVSAEPKPRGRHSSVRTLLALRQHALRSCVRIQPVNI